jgi:hypothetical protein
MQSRESNKMFPFSKFRQNFPATRGTLLRAAERLREAPIGQCEAPETPSRKPHRVD